MNRSLLCLTLLSCQPGPEHASTPRQRLVLPTGDAATSPGLKLLLEPDGSSVADLRLASALASPWVPGCDLLATPDCASTTAREQHGTVESWTQEPEGLHHRFLLRRPERKPLRLVLSLDGATSEQAGTDAVVLRTARKAYRYAGLTAIDEAGRVLPTSMEATGAAVVLHVDATGSVGAIDVDPVLSEVDQDIPGPQTFGRFGVTLGSGGDANHDGYDDVASGGNYGGFWIPGSPTGLQFTWDGYYDYFDENPQGFYMAGGGDVDGDGVDDLVQMINGFGHRLILGVPGGTPVAQERLPRIGGGLAADLLIGDFNNDGIDDLVRAYYDPYYDAAGTYDLFVTSGGPNIQTDYTYRRLPVTPPNAPCIEWGLNLTRGDVTGDGIDDLLVNVYDRIAQGAVSAEAWLYAGSPNGIEVVPSWSWLPHDPSERAGDVREVSIAPDLDGDGRDDIVASGDERVWWLSSQDLGGTPELVGGWTGFYFSATAHCGGYSDYIVSTRGIGDINGDGYGDLGVTNAEDAKVFLGGPDGPLPTPYFDIPYQDDAVQHYTNFVGDPNGDGYHDIAIFNYGDSPQHPQISGALDLYWGGAIDDIDQDGVDNDDDCDPYRADIAPNLIELPGTPDDEDCNGFIACWTDQDGDGVGGTLVSLPVGAGACTDPGLLTTGGDCDDTVPTVFPGATEVPDNEVDEDCDGLVDCHVDRDGDGFGGMDLLVSCAADPDWTLDDQDCDDSNAEVSPLMVEVVGNAHDDDCDGSAACFEDLDGDHAGIAGTLVWSTDASCVHPGMGFYEDCDETDPLVSPHLEDLPGDAIDQDCDGLLRCFIDEDGDGYGVEATVLSVTTTCEAPGIAATDDDCDDSAPGTNNGAVEVPGNGVDEDCTGLDAGWRDGDGDGFAPLGAAVQEVSHTYTSPIAAADCNDLDDDIHPGAMENFSNTIDEDCNGLLTCLADADGDGYGACIPIIDGNIPLDRPELLSFCPSYAEFVEIVVGQQCGIAPGTSSLMRDCDDENPMIYYRHYSLGLDRPENEIDEDCSGQWNGYLDVDGDGYGADVTSSPTLGPPLLCDSGCLLTYRGGDCDDTNPAIRPDQPQTSPTIDTNCNGHTSATLTFTPRPDRRLAVEVLDLPPNALVQLARSTTAPTTTTCPPTGPCALLTNPTVLTGTADANGRAFWILTLPPAPTHGATTWFQAIAGPGPALATPVTSWTDGPMIAFTDLGNRTFRVDLMGLPPNVPVLLDQAQHAPNLGTCPPTVVCRRLAPADISRRGTTDALGRAAWNVRFPYTVWPLEEIHFQAVTGIGPEQATPVGTFLTPYLEP
jgi:hypothetical protein